MLFKELNLIEPIQKSLEQSAYTTATPVQEKSIPHILQGKDLIGIAQTGTGKTAAFTLPLLQNMYNQSKKITFTTPKTLILAPTRELAIQIGENINKYSKFTSFKTTVIYGGVPQINQVNKIKSGTDIIIATPGRLLDLLNQELIELSQIEYLVLDEADRMLDMGFITDVEEILNKLPKQKQSLFFSATMPKEIIKLTEKFTNNPIKIEITQKTKSVEKIKQQIFFIDTLNKNELLLELIKPQEIEKVIVFTRTKHKADKIAKYLNQNEILSESIHGDKKQLHREEILEDFKAKKIKALIATEVLARGIDINDVSHIINYELPKDPESFLHRIGRTARAGTHGIAYSFCCADEREYLENIEKLINETIPVNTKHRFHSDFAMNATGDDARPQSKQEFHKNNNNSNNPKKKKKYNFKISNYKNKK